MKRSIALVLAATLSVSPVVLTACGGSSSGGDGGGAAVTQQDTQTQQSANAKESFAGTWKTVYAELDGVYYAGDFTSVGEAIGAYEYKLNSDGTGVVTLDDKSYDLTWDLTDNEHVTLNVKDMSEETLRYDKDHDALYMDATADDPDVIALRKDGIPDESYGLKLKEAVPVKKLSDVVGSWTIYGMAINGAMFYGDPDKLPSALENMEEYALTIQEDGSTLLGEVKDWKAVEQDGTVALVKGDKTAPLKTLNDILMFNIGEDTNELIVFYKK